MESILLSQPGSSSSNTSAPRTLTTDVDRNGVNASEHSPRDQSGTWGNNHRTSLGQRVFGDGAERREPRLSRGPSSPHHSTVNAPEASYMPRGPYVQIDPEAATEQNQMGSGVHLNTGSGQEAGILDSRARTWSAILKEKGARRRLITLITSAVFLILVLAIFLAFAASRSSVGQELHILLIFMILILAIVLCHSLIRFCMGILRGPKFAVARNRIPSRAGPSGYAQPERPIHVVLAGDEEAQVETRGIIREKVAAPPPAYGLWRSSVKMNPDLLYWQRVGNDAPPCPDRLARVEETSSSKTATPRPPSYTSDDGIDYVVEAQPRSFTQCRISEEPERR